MPSTLSISPTPPYLESQMDRYLYYSAAAFTTLPASSGVLAPTTSNSSIYHAENHMATSSTATAATKSKDLEEQLRTLKDQNRTENRGTSFNSSASNSSSKPLEYKVQDRLKDGVHGISFDSWLTQVSHELGFKPRCSFDWTPPESPLNARDQLSRDEAVQFASRMEQFTKIGQDNLIAAQAKQKKKRIKRDERSIGMSRIRIYRPISEIPLK